MRFKIDAGTHVRYRLKDADGSEKEVLPWTEDPGKWNQLTIGMDPGSVGRGGAGFARNKLVIFVYVVYDIIHKLIRDLKLAMETCPDVHKAVLCYTFIMSLNYRPFNSGVWFDEKKATLQHLLETLPNKHRNQSFRKWATKWARDMKPCGPCSTDEDFEALWDKMPELETFCAKTENPKAMRWFSVNSCCEDNFEEFWPLKMVMGYDQVGDECADDGVDEPFEDPSALAARNPRAELKELKSATGGLKLARKLLTPWLHSTIRVYFWGSKATWTMFTEQCKPGKIPKQQLLRYLF